MVRDNAAFNKIMNAANVGGGRMVKTTSSPQCYKWHFVLDNPNNINKVKRCIPAFTAVNGAPVTVEPSIYGHFAISISREQERIFPRTLDCKMVMESGNILLGVDEDGESVVRNIKDTRSILVAGSSGSGKSVALGTMIMSLAQSSPKTTNLILIDLKRVEFSLYADLPHLYTPPIYDAHEAVEMLKAVLSIIRYRYNLMEQLHARKADFETLPALVVFIDEYAELATSGVVKKSELETIISRIAATGRACNVFLVISTQYPISSIISNAIRVNLPTKLGLRTANTAQSINIIGSRKCCDLLGKGDAILAVDGELPQRVQMPYLSDDDIDYLLGNVRQ